RPDSIVLNSNSTASARRLLQHNRHIATLCGNAALRSLSERSGYWLSSAYRKRIYDYTSSGSHRDRVARHAGGATQREQPRISLRNAATSSSQPGLGSHQFRAALADDGARRAKRGSSNAWRLKPNSRRSAGASTSTRSRESYATRSCASENFTAKSSPTSSARRSAGSTRKSKRNAMHWRATSASFAATSPGLTAPSPR